MTPQDKKNMSPSSETCSEFKTTVKNEYDVLRTKHDGSLSYKPGIWNRDKKISIIFLSQLS